MPSGLTRDFLGNQSGIGMVMTDMECVGNDALKQARQWIGSRLGLVAGVRLWPASRLLVQQGMKGDPRSAG